MNKTIQLLTLSLFSLVVFLGVSFWLVKQSVAGLRMFVISSGSMRPTLAVGSVILTHLSDTYDVGDIISFYRDKQVITHRITQVMSENNTTQYKTRGDANQQPDSQLVNHDQILGKTLIIIPLIGYIVSWVQQPMGVVTLIIIPSTLLIADEVNHLLSLIKYAKK